MVVISAISNQSLAPQPEVAQEIATQVEEYWKLYEQGTSLLCSNYQEALLLFEQAITIAPLQPEAWYGRGDALANLADYSTALASFDRAIELDSTQPETWTFRGVVLIHLEHYADALVSCNRALEIQPDHKEAWLFRAVALQKLGHYQAAYFSFDRALGVQRKSAGQRFAEWLNRCLKQNKSITKY